MLVYRINSNFDGNAGYNGADVLDEVYIYRPNGTTFTNGNPNQANFSQLVNRNEIHSGTNPTPFLSYGTPGGLDIRQITDNDGTLSFLLIVNVPNDLILYLPNTSGDYYAFNSITMADGFSTQPNSDFNAIIPGNKESLRNMEEAFQNSNQSELIIKKNDRIIRRLVINNPLPKNIYPETWDGKDNNNRPVLPGKYTYMFINESDQIVKGAINIKD